MVCVYHVKREKDGCALRDTVHRSWGSGVPSMFIKEQGTTSRCFPAPGHKITLQIDNVTFLTLIVLGEGGLFGPCDAKFSDKCPCLHNNYTAFIEQISLFDP